MWGLIVFFEKNLEVWIIQRIFAPTRTRQASQRCSNVRVVLFLYDEQQNSISEIMTKQSTNMI